VRTAGRVTVRSTGRRRYALSTMATTHDRSLADFCASTGERGSMPGVMSAPRSVSTPP
jgi:hypothetical protein